MFQPANVINVYRQQIALEKNVRHTKPLIHKDDSQFKIAED